MVITGVKLATRLDNLLENKKITKLYDYKQDHMGMLTYLGNIYDLNTNSIVFNDTMEVISSYDEIIFMSKPRKSDSESITWQRKLKMWIKNMLKNHIRQL